MSESADRLAKALREVIEYCKKNTSANDKKIDALASKTLAAIRSYEAQAEVSAYELEELDLLRSLEYSVRYGGDAKSILDNLDRLAEERMRGHE